VYYGRSTYSTRNPFWCESTGGWKEAAQDAAKEEQQNPQGWQDTEEQQKPQGWQEAEAAEEESQTTEEEPQTAQVNNKQFVIFDIILYYQK
jgi:hypothetical protein